MVTGSVHHFDLIMNHYYSLKTATNVNHQDIGIKAKPKKKPKVVIVMLMSPKVSVVMQM